MSETRDLSQLIRNILVNNRRESGEYQYTVPSPESYPYQWLWDSCFHAVILTRFDTEDAKKELRSLVSRQFENGLIPHVIYWEKSNVLNVDWGLDGTSSLTQPPIIAYAVLRIYEKDSDKEFLKEIYPNLAKYYRYIVARDVRGNNLVGIINPDESGEDNSPRFDEQLGMAPKHSVEEHNRKRFKLFEENKRCNFDAVECMSKSFWAKDVPFNAYLVENLHSLAEIAGILGHSEDATYFREKAFLIKDAMRKFMFEDGTFWNVFGADVYKKVKVKTWAMFAPLIGDILTTEEASVMIEKYLTNKNYFWSKYPVPTVSMDEASYSPNEPEWGKAWEHPNWRGPVWMAPNWFLYRGLKKYGFKDEARQIREKSLELVLKEGCREYYHPETGAGMGAQSFTWAGLVLDMD